MLGRHRRGVDLLGASLLDSVHQIVQYGEHSASFRVSVSGVRLVSARQLRTSPISREPRHAPADQLLTPAARRSRLVRSTI